MERTGVSKPVKQIEEMPQWMMQGLRLAWKTKHRTEIDWITTQWYKYIRDVYGYKSKVGW